MRGSGNLDIDHLFLSSQTSLLPASSPFYHCFMDPSSRSYLVSLPNAQPLCLAWPMSSQKTGLSNLQATFDLGLFTGHNGTFSGYWWDFIFHFRCTAKDETLFSVCSLCVRQKSLILPSHLNWHNQIRLVPLFSPFYRSRSEGSGFGSHLPKVSQLCSILECACQPLHHTPLRQPISSPEYNQIPLEVMKDCSWEALRKEGSKNQLGEMISEFPCPQTFMILAHRRCSINVDQ